MSESSRHKVKIADIHCHLLPSVDDGSQSMQETLEMLKIAQSEGITHMVFTPHYKAHRRRRSRIELEQIFEDCQKEVERKGIDIELFLGNEVLYFSEIEDALRRGSICCMNGGRYILVEFSPHDDYHYIRNGLDVIASLGYKPVLAHIERYACMVKHPEYAKELFNRGVKIQVNAASVNGELGFGIKRYTRKLLSDQLVRYIATDAHSPRHRAPRIKKCYEFCYRKYGKEYAARIFYKNAAKDFNLR